jgi:hypothetical protein
MTRKEEKKLEAQFNKRSKVLKKDKAGNILKIMRGRDGAILEVGMKTPSGKILTIAHDKKYAGGMKAEMDELGKFTAIPNIALYKTLRESVFERIEEIRQHSGNFSKTTMRWQSVIVNDKHVSEVNLAEVDEETLLKYFEKIVRKYYTQM